MTLSLFSDDPSPCPRCGRPDPLPLFFEPISDEMHTAAQLGQIALRNSPTTDPPPHWLCQERHCSFEF
jgi:hypothetical protein